MYASVIVDDHLFFVIFLAKGKESPFIKKTTHLFMKPCLYTFSSATDSLR